MDPERGVMEETEEGCGMEDLEGEGGRDVSLESLSTGCEWEPVFL